MRRSTHLSFACPKERWKRKRHPANAACGYSALLVPDRRSPTRCAQTRLASLLSGTAMLDALEGNWPGVFSLICRNRAHSANNRPRCGLLQQDLVNTTTATYAQPSGSGQTGNKRPYVRAQRVYGLACLIEYAREPAGLCVGANGFGDFCRNKSHSGAPMRASNKTSRSDSKYRK